MRSLAVFLTLVFLAHDLQAEQKIDRRAVVERHNVVLGESSPSSPLSVGNGEFAYTFDVTGLQTFPVETPGTVPLSTMAQWSWHSFAQGSDFKYEDTLREYTAHGRKVTYATDMQSETARYFRANPHRFSLARIALRLIHPDGSRAAETELSDTQQTLFLWKGEAKSSFKFSGQDVEVTTIAHPELDAVAFSIKSPSVGLGRLGIEISFAYPAGEWGPQVDDWNSAGRHVSVLEMGQEFTRIVRKLDASSYRVSIWSTGSLRAGDEPHRFLLNADDQESLEAVFLFTHNSAATPTVPDFATTEKKAHEYWQRYWSVGGIVDLSGSKHPRWKELERRVVLSQYLTAVNCAGSMPPQETGLVCNSWFGKSHLEMHWWHAAHFALWGRPQLLERSLEWYEQILSAARRIAQRQGYAGVRWPKMTGPQGISSPSEVGELLIWQQPHPIYFAELIYRCEPERKTLEKYASLVCQTADFMADYAEYNQAGDRYVLGPVLIPAQECYDGRDEPGVLNPTFELAYWRWALETANSWRERLGLPRDEKWQEVVSKISTPHVESGVYSAIENAPFTRRRDHPSMLGALGILPDVHLVDRSTMSRTLDDVLADWQWPDTWGWDYPMMAMTAARLKRPEVAIDCLLFDTPKNHYRPNGHCWQANRLPLYLPANGGLLTAIGMMAAGWDGTEPRQAAPGFPSDGTWTVRSEGILPMP